jgi:hypothetical protein
LASGNRPAAILAQLMEEAAEKKRILEPGLPTRSAFFGLARHLLGYEDGKADPVYKYFPDGIPAGEAINASHAKCRAFLWSSSKMTRQSSLTFQGSAGYCPTAD